MSEAKQWTQNDFDFDCYWIEGSVWDGENCQPILCFVGADESQQKLVLAAPDLLAACQAALAMLAPVVAGRPMPNGQCLVAVDLLAAIKKATE